MYINNEVKCLYDTIGKDLEKYFCNYKIEDIYTYDFSISNLELFTKDEIFKINNLKNGFEKNIELKILLSNKLKDAKNKGVYYKWIVTEWGGIGSFKQKEEEIEKFLLNVSKNKLNSLQFNTIASYSKIISFIYPFEYFIFDSRVAFVLNWLLLKNYKKDNKYFLNPPGRNADIVKYNMDTIISLYKKHDEKLFFKKNEIYFIYCDFVKYVHKNMKNERIKFPYYIEMILFGLFDKICCELKNSVNVIIE